MRGVTFWRKSTTWPMRSTRLSSPARPRRSRGPFHWRHRSCRRSFTWPKLRRTFAPDAIAFGAKVRRSFGQVNDLRQDRCRQWNGPRDLRGLAGLDNLVDLIGQVVDFLQKVTPRILAKLLAIFSQPAG